MPLNMHAYNGRFHFAPKYQILTPPKLPKYSVYVQYHNNNITISAHMQPTVHHVKISLLLLLFLLHVQVQYGK